MMLLPASFISLRQRVNRWTWLALGTLAACGTPASPLSDDQDGIVEGEVTFSLTVNDSEFAPAILKTQNLATVTLMVSNQGTVPHGFAVACNGTSCFPSLATVAPVAPGATATTVFQTPRVEGLYTFTTGVPGEGLQGQFIVQ